MCMCVPTQLRWPIHIFFCPSSTGHASLWLAWFYVHNSLFTPSQLHSPDIFLYLDISNTISKEIFILILHRKKTENMISKRFHSFVLVYSFIYSSFLFTFVFVLFFFAGKLSSFTHCSPQFRTEKKLCGKVERKHTKEKAK